MPFPICGLLLTYCASLTPVTEFPHEAARAAGFALMHAAWSVSDLPKGENLVPLALVKKGGEQKLYRFESKTSNKNAVDEGLKQLKKEEKTLHYWALVFDGYEHDRNGKSDALVVQVWSTHSTHTLYFFQKYEPFGLHGKFKILGKEQIAIDGTNLTGKEAQPIIDDVEMGLKSHPKFDLWKNWRVDVD